MSTFLTSSLRKILIFIALLMNLLSCRIIKSPGIKNANSSNCQSQEELTQAAVWVYPIKDKKILEKLNGAKTIYEQMLKELVLIRSKGRKTSRSKTCIPVSITVEIYFVVSNEKNVLFDLERAGLYNTDYRLYNNNRAEGSINPIYLEKLASIPEVRRIIEKRSIMSLEASKQ